MAVTPSRVNFNNVTSMGVSYDWSHGQGAVIPCPGITNQEGRNNDWIERVKTIDLEVANLDLSNAGNAVISDMAAQQDKYVNTATHSIYANGLYAGNGYLTSYSINEGSLSNASTTNLSYSMRDGGEDPNEGDDADNPVTRTESIKVTRDIKGKSYSIDHSYSVSYGSDFDLVTDFPLYKDNPEYKSVDGRLALAEQEAQTAVNNDVSNYGDYIDLSPYMVGNGFNLTKINNGCSGVFTSSNESKNFINGDYTYSKNTVLKYTGENLDTGIDPYEIDYSISWNQKGNIDEAGDCVTIVFQGAISANKGSVQDCSEDGEGAGTIAESGFEEWVTGPSPKGIQKVIEFYEAISGQLSVPNADSYPLVEEILSYKKQECVPSVNKGAENDGIIEFEFEMSTCPENNAGGTQYEYSQSTSTSFSQGGCEGAQRRITEISVDGDVQSNCGQNLSSDGGYPKWSNIESVFGTKKASGFASGPGNYEGEFSLRLASESTSINKYDGSASYTYAWTDAPFDENCDAPAEAGCSEAFGVSIKNTTTPAMPRYVNTITSIGSVSEVKGKTPARRAVSINIKSKATEQKFPLNINSVMTEAKCQINKNKPACVIDSLSVQITKNQEQGEDRISASATVEGIEDIP